MTRRLLVVDDEPNLLTAIAAVLRGEGFEVTTARNGKDALVEVAGSIPDLIVSDIRMPVMDGYKLARHLRAAPHTKLIPIVFLTAKDETEDRIEGFRAGIDVYLTKPFEPDELIAVVNNILRRVERTHSALTALVSEAPPEHQNGLYTDLYDEELTEAERRISLAVARGLGNKDIATELNISVRTVESHIGRILAKKHFSNRVEIARHVLSHQDE